MKRTIIWAAALAAGFYFGVPTAAGATEQPEPVCATWTARGATGVYPAIVFGGKPVGTEISASTAKLTKPEGVSPGVEFASFDLGIGTLAQEAIVRVEYATSDGASTSAGAVRMFAYYDKDADTLNDAPDHVATAQAESGNLLFTVPDGKKIGTLGLVFDASNNTTGVVTFSNLTIGDRPVSFTPCPAPTTPPTTVPTTVPTTAPTTSPATTAPTTAPTTVPPTDGPTTAPPTTAVPTVTATAEWTCAMFETQQDAQDAFEKDPVGLAELDADGDGYACEFKPDTAGGGLPLTGPSILLTAGLGVALVGTAGLVLYLVRRRKVSFTP